MLINLKQHSTLGLLAYVCISPCTTVIHNTAHNSSDNFPSYPLNNRHTGSSDAVNWRGRGRHYTGLIVFHGEPAFGQMYPDPEQSFCVVWKQHEPHLITSAPRPCSYWLNAFGSILESPQSRPHWYPSPRPASHMYTCTAQRLLLAGWHRPPSPASAGATVTDTTNNLVKLTIL